MSNNLIINKKIKNFDKKINYSKYSQKNYPIKLYDRSLIGKVKSTLFKKFFKTRIDQTISKFKKTYPKKELYEIFKKNQKNLSKYIKNL